MALKALCGMRFPGCVCWGVGVTGYSLVKSKVFLTVVALAREVIRLCEESSTECHQKGADTKNDVLLVPDTVWAPDILNGGLPLDGTLCVELTGRSLLLYYFR